MSDTRHQGRYMLCVTLLVFPQKVITILKYHRRNTTSRSEMEKEKNRDQDCGDALKSRHAWSCLAGASTLA